MILSQNPFLTVAIVIFLAAAVYLARRSFLAIRKFSLTPLAFNNRSYAFSRRLLAFKYLCFMLALVFLGLAALRPEWGDRIVKSEGQGIDLVFVLDVSKSMKALDMSSSGQESDRLTASKNMIAQYVSENPDNRYALVVFAGEAFVSTPLTFDNEAFLTFLGTVDYDSVSRQGTNLEEALKASISRFSATPDEERGKALILISDGGDSSSAEASGDKEVTGNFMGFAQEAKKEGIRIFTIGVGSKTPVPIPSGTDFFGRVSYETYQGQPVLVKLNEKPLKDIAAAADGLYFQAAKADDLKKISSGLNGLKTSTLERSEKRQGEDRYQFFLLPSFFFFLLFIFIKPKKPDTNRFGVLLKNKFKLLPLLFLIPVLTGCSNNRLLFTYHLDKGNGGFDQEYYSEAFDNYQKAEKDSISLKYIASNNSGLADYRQEKFDEAAGLFEKLAKDCETARRDYCDQIFYNAGNAYYRQGEKTDNKEEKKSLWEKAISSYKKTLIINQGDKEASENIDFIQNKIKELDSADSKQSSSGQGQNSQQSKGDEGKSASSSPDGQNGGDGQKQDGKSGESGGSGQSQSQAGSTGQEKGKEGTQGASQAPAGKEGGNSQPGGESGQGGETSPSGNDSLTPEQKSQLDAYMQQMESQQRNLGQYFQQKPGQKTGDPNDPFAQFDELFNNAMGGRKLRGIDDNGSEKDW